MNKADSLACLCVKQASQWRWGRVGVLVYPHTLKKSIEWYSRTTFNLVISVNSVNTDITGD